MEEVKLEVSYFLDKGETYTNTLEKGYLLTKYVPYFLRTFPATNAPATTPAPTATPNTTNIPKYVGMFGQNVVNTSIIAPATTPAIVTTPASFSPANAGTSFSASFLITAKDIVPTIAPKTTPTIAPKTAPIITYSITPVYIFAATIPIATPPPAMPPPIPPTTKIRVLRVIRFCFAWSAGDWI